MQKKEVKVVAILPIGPGNDGVDTIESIFFYMGPSVHIIVADDTKSPLTKEKLEKMDSRITVMHSKGHGDRGGLWTNLAYAYRYAVENFNFKVLFRVDTDALVIGFGAEDQAIKFFTENPKVGMLGSYKVDCNGDTREFWVASNSIGREAGIRGIFRPQRRRLLSGWVKKAKKNGYEIGEHILGGANFQSYACIKSMVDNGFLNDPMLLIDSGISEDFIFSMLTIACGYALGDFATGDLPMGLRWRGLPDSPEKFNKKK